MQIWILGGLAASLAAASAAVVSTTIPIAGPLYACHVPAGTATEPPVVSWAEGDGVIVVPGRNGQPLPRYVSGQRDLADDAPQRLRLAPDALQPESASLTLPSGLALACELNNED
jgi:hypothetical protein